MIKKDDSENQDSSENSKKSAEPKGKEIEWLDRFRFHHFLSLSKTRNMPYKEWQGETKNDEIVIVNYKEGVVIIGAGYNEIKARQNMFALCETRDKLGLLRHDNRIDIYNVNDLLKLEWVFPEGYLEE